MNKKKQRLFTQLLIRRSFGLQGAEVFFTPKELLLEKDQVVLTVFLVSFRSLFFLFCHQGFFLRTLFAVLIFTHDFILC